MEKKFTEEDLTIYSRIQYLENQIDKYDNERFELISKLSRGMYMLCDIWYYVKSY